MKGCVFEKKRKNKNQNKNGIERTFHKVKKVVFVTHAVIKTGAEWKSRFVNEAFILIFAQMTSCILLVGRTSCQLFAPGVCAYCKITKMI